MLQIRKENDIYYAKSSVVDGVYKIDSRLGRAVDKGLDEFRDKKLFDFGFSEPSKVEMQNGSKSYFLTKGGQDWWSNGVKMDTGAVGSYISSLRDLSASKFVQSGFTNPTVEISVTSGDGKRVEKVSIAKSGSSYIAKRESDPTFYEVDASSVETLLKSANNIKPATSHG